MANTGRTLTVRLPEALYNLAREMAMERKLSLNTLMQQALQAEANLREEQRLYESFGLLGEDADEADVEFAFAAQREVVMGEGRKGARQPRRNQAGHSRQR